MLGPDVPLDEAIRISEDLRFTRPSMSVILVRAGFDTDVLAEAMQAGCREVVAERDPAGVGEAVERAHQVWLALHGGSVDSANGHLITVFSPKGGVGKTTIAANLAVALAATGPCGSAWSTSTSASATSRSPCSCSRRAPSRTRSAPRSCSTSPWSSRCSPVTRSR